MNWLKKFTNPGKPGFSKITSMEQVHTLLHQGDLFRILLFPPEFGGTDDDRNVVYVPAGIPEIKDQLTGTLVRFTNEGIIDQLAVEPEYRGQSLIPCKIKMRAWHSEKPGGINPSIDIW